jgi:hypothetical protein
MPDRDVKTIRDLIYYQYAKVIALQVFGAERGQGVIKYDYEFVRNTFWDFKTGAKSWSEATEEDVPFAEMEKQCVYCGVEEDLHPGQLVPRSLRIKPECETCDTIQGTYNQVWACGRCDSMKSAKGLYQFFKVKFPKSEKFYDLIPPSLEKKYLKVIYNCHLCAGTLDSGDIDDDGELTVLDIDHIIV